MVEKKISLFVCAVGVPPKDMVDKLHAAGIIVMKWVHSPNFMHEGTVSHSVVSMIGHPKVTSDQPSQCLHQTIVVACEEGTGSGSAPLRPMPATYSIKCYIGVDMICAQGGEGGGHTGDTPFSVLIPAVVDLCRDAKSPLTGEPIIVIAAGGIADGRGLAAALSYGASGVWVGTRFVASEESAAPPMHKQLILSAGYGDMVKTLVYSGRPLHVRKTEYVRDW